MAKKSNQPGWQGKIATNGQASGVRGKVNLRPQDFDDLINAQGILVKVYRSMLCPQVKSIDGAEHEIDCKLCNGSGIIDMKPRECKSFIQGQTLDKLPFVEGLVDGNAVVGSFPRGIELQYFTKVELCDFTEIFYERVKRSEGQIDTLKYRAKCVNAIMDEDGIEYFMGNDFSLDQNGSIKWKVGKGPDIDIIYSIHYEAAVQYRAVKALHSNRFAQVDIKGGAEFTKMPEQWIMQKEFLVRRTDATGKDLNLNLIRGADNDFDSDYEDDF